MTSPCHLLAYLESSFSLKDMKLNAAEGFGLLVNFCFVCVVFVDFGVSAKS